MNPQRLILHERLVYDRAYGRAWFMGKNAPQCRTAAEQAVLKDRARRGKYK
jgi:hypothetical protein